MLNYIVKFVEEEASEDNIHDLLEKHIGDKSGGVERELSRIVSKFIREMPRALEAVLEMSRDKRCRRALSFGFGQVITYIVDEEDLFPESKFGAIGLVDDAYLAHSFVAKIIQTYPFLETSKTKYEPPDKQTLEIIKKLLPQGISHALDTTINNLLQVSSALFSYGEGEPIDEPNGIVLLRVKDAEELCLTI